MGELIRFPRTKAALTRAVERLAEELELARAEQQTVAQAFAAAELGDFDHEAVRAVLNGQAGALDVYLDLCELIRVVSAARRHCGLEPGS